MLDRDDFRKQAEAMTNEDLKTAWGLSVDQLVRYWDMVEPGKNPLPSWEAAVMEIEDKVEILGEEMQKRGLIKTRPKVGRRG